MSYHKLALNGYRIAQHYIISRDAIRLARKLHAADHSFAAPVSLSTVYYPVRFVFGGSMNSYGADNA